MSPRDLSRCGAVVVGFGRRPYESSRTTCLVYEVGSVRLLARSLFSSVKARVFAPLDESLWFDCKVVIMLVLTWAPTSIEFYDDVVEWPAALDLCLPDEGCWRVDSLTLAIFYSELDLSGLL